MTSPSSSLILGVCAAAGLVGAAFLVSQSLNNMKLADRSVSVRGLAEREVRADLGVWMLKTRIAGDDLVAAQSAMDANLAKIKAFLTEAGFKAEEVEVKGLRVVDKNAQEYSSNDVKSFRYLVDANVVVRTPNVDAMVAATAKMGELLKAGVALVEENNCTPGPSYSFTKLNDIKPDMLKVATKNAREAAQQFAENSGSKIGALKNASQGVFSITARDNVEEGAEGGGCQPSDPNKKVRVVTGLQYYLD